MSSNNDNDDVMIMIIPLCQTRANMFEDKMCVNKKKNCISSTITLHVPLQKF